MSSLAMINIAKKQLGLDEETYRSSLIRVTGKSSLRDMSEPERLKVIDDFKSKGFKAVRKVSSRTSKKRLEGRYTAKMQALWIAGYNLGVVTNGSDEALIAFVQRQTKLDHIRFLHDPADAYTAIESLKRWLNRAAGVSWAKDNFLPDWANKPHGQIALTQWSILKKQNLMVGTEFASTAWAICGHEGKPKLNNLTEKEWQLVMNKLGESIRKICQA